MVWYGFRECKWLIFVVFAGLLIGVAVAKNSFTDAWIAQSVNVYLSFEGNEDLETSAQISLDMEHFYNETAFLDFSGNAVHANITDPTYDIVEAYYGLGIEDGWCETDSGITTETYTVMGWICPNQDDSLLYIVSKKNVDSWRFGWSGVSEKLYCRVYGSGDFYSNATIPKTSWGHVALQRVDGSLHRFYINGSASGDFNSNDYLPNTALYIGRRNASTSYNWVGVLDDFRFFEGVLSQDEITNYMNAPVAMRNNVYSSVGDTVGLYLQNGSLYEQQVLSGEVAHFDVFDIQNESVISYKIAHDDIRFESTALVFHVGDAYTFNIVEVYSSDMIKVAIVGVFLAVGVVWMAKRWVG